ncbi:hypothetical protein G6M84_10195 [Agrobacterium tumefaciens]|uniref:hypothetical protein n=1 Tax=Agrobacterium tumefaciens TaxID=358 RepID=UPI0015717D5D|nr:hypothetical protein [Agrobacterium tumefaciens]NTB96887.1 hypothetical protein [Agrobacterium tumefaciens]NTC44199.1 hypothetical protein [Agrobacterium tumefaciens]
MVRSGFSLSLFVALEDHINAAARQALSELAQSKMAYSDFPVPLRKILILNALSGVGNYLSLNKSFTPQQALTYAENEVVRLSKFNGPVREYSGAGFNFKGSNLYADDIANFLKSFAGSAGWAYLSAIVTEIGGSRPDLLGDFESLGRDRHKMAHSVEPQLDLSTLQLRIDAAVAIAIAFGIAAYFLSHQVRSVNSFALVDTTRNDYVNHLRYLRSSPRGLAEIAPSGKVLKYFHDLRTAVVAILAKSNVNIVVLKDEQGLPVDVFFKGRSY